MATVADLIDRTYLEWLYRPDDLPARTVLVSDVAAGAPTFRFNNSMLTTDEQNLLGRGTIIEVGTELVTITAVNLAQGTFQALRGQHGTVDAAHSAGDVVYLAPHFPRHAVFNAVADAVVDLYPDLWHTRTETVTSASFVELSADTTGVLRARTKYNGTYRDVGTVFLKEFPDSSTEVAIQFPDLADNVEVLVTTRQRFTRPTAETDTVSDIEPDWEQLVVLGAAIGVLAGTDVDAVRQDYVTEAFQQQGFPPGSGSRLSRDLIRLYEYKMQKARRSLHHRYPLPTTIGAATYGGF